MWESIEKRRCFLNVWKVAMKNVFFTRRNWMLTPFGTWGDSITLFQTKSWCSQLCNTLPLLASGNFFRKIAGWILCPVHEKGLRPQASVVLRASQWVTPPPPRRLNWFKAIKCSRVKLVNKCGMLHQCNRNACQVKLCYPYLQSAFGCGIKKLLRTNWGETHGKIRPSNADTWSDCATLPYSKFTFINEIAIIFLQKIINLSN